MPVCVKDWPYPRWVAHRGAGKLAPENTLAAFRLGAEHGYRMFECDVKLSRDGVPFLLHDATLERTTDGRGAAGDLPWQRAGPARRRQLAFAALCGEPLASLENVARFCLRNGCLLNIEIKPTPGAERETGEIVAQQAARLWADAAVPPLLTSFQAESLRPRAAPRRTCRAGCCSTRCRKAGWRRAPTSTAWPSSASTRCGMPPPSHACRPPACAR